MSLSLKGMYFSIFGAVATLRSFTLYFSDNVYALYVYSTYSMRTLFCLTLTSLCDENKPV